MNQKSVWDDDSRSVLCGRLRTVILGGIRFQQSTPDEILGICQDFYIEEECPEDERESFGQFAADELQRCQALYESEKANWPEVTDCDRLDRVEAALRERGILFWQASACCDNCTRAELPDRLDVIQQRYPGFRDRARGYAFFIDQDMEERLAEGTSIGVWLGYGWLPEQDAQFSREEYEAQALAIAREVCTCLSNEGLEPDWTGKLCRNIRIGVNWQRRTLLE